MKAKTEQRVKRWNDQRWMLDSVIQAVGMEWDQPRLNYTMAPAGGEAIVDFRTVAMRVRKFADIHREFAAAARRRPAAPWRSGRWRPCRCSCWSPAGERGSMLPIQRQIRHITHLTNCTAGTTLKIGIRSGRRRSP